MNIKSFKCPLCGEVFPIWMAEELEGVKGPVCRECLLLEHPEYEEE